MARLKRCPSTPLHWLANTGSSASTRRECRVLPPCDQTRGAEGDGGQGETEVSAGRDVPVGRRSYFPAHRRDAQEQHEEATAYRAATEAARSHRAKVRFSGIRADPTPTRRPPPCWRCSCTCWALRRTTPAYSPVAAFPAPGAARVRSAQTGIVWPGWRRLHHHRARQPRGMRPASTPHGSPSLAGQVSLTRD